MRSIQTGFAFPLLSVKPLDGLIAYRAYCLGATRAALQGAVQRRQQCIACMSELVSHGEIEDPQYVRCPACDSIFLYRIAAPFEWRRLLMEVSKYRHSPRAFHSSIAQSRYKNVYTPKLEWIQSTLRLQGVIEPRVMEVITPPSDFTQLLVGSGSFAEVLSVNEMEMVMRTPSEPPLAQDLNRRDASIHAAVLLESLDRVPAPAELLSAVAQRLIVGGLLFVTAAVCSGFDMTVLGLRNFYMYPPDRTNCFSLRGLELLLTRAGFRLLEISTPGVLDVEVVLAHLQQNPLLPLSPFETRLLASDADTREAFQTFLQQNQMSSFARVVAIKHS